MFALYLIGEMANNYRKPLPKLEVVRAAFPEQFAELDALASTASLEAFGAKARSRTGEGWEQVARYAAIREMQSRYETPAQPLADQYSEDCAAERVWVAVLHVGKMDRVTQRLVAKHGFLGGMVAQLDPIAKIGRGNFPLLKAKGLADCSAEFCVWRWGLDYISEAKRARLAIIAEQCGFDKT